MKCPVCNIDLVMSERSGVEIDYCPECRGVWLDRGELDKIIDRSSQSSGFVAGNSKSESRYEEPSSNRYENSQHYNNDHNSKNKKKRDSFLGDLFDF